MDTVHFAVAVGSSQIPPEQTPCPTPSPSSSTQHRPGMWLCLWTKVELTWISYKWPGWPCLDCEISQIKLNSSFFLPSFQEVFVEYPLHEAAGIWQDNPILQVLTVQWRRETSKKMMVVWLTSPGMSESRGHRRALDGQCQLLGGIQVTWHLNWDL